MMDLWKELFLHKLMASASNRLIYEISGEQGYNYIANQLSNSKNPKLWLKNHYSFGSIKKLIYPIAKYIRTLVKIFPLAYIKIEF